MNSICSAQIKNAFNSILHSSLFLLIFLITHGSSENSPADNLIGGVSINCGSSTGASSGHNNREWIGDTNPKLASSIQIKGSSTISTVIHQSAADPVPHRTARISLSRFSYTFHLPSGPKIIRLYFNPSRYKNFRKSEDLFSVEAGSFTLLSNFSASLTADVLGVDSFVKEFCIDTEQNRPLTIVFSASNSCSSYRTYAFINGIEIISVPKHLSYFMSGDFGVQVVGKSRVYVDDSTALELVHRLNVRSDSFSFSDINMFPVLETPPNHRSEERKNLTWKKEVDIGFRYLIRVHFDRLGLEMTATDHTFKVLINEMIADTSDEILKDNGENGIVRYRDYIVAIKGGKHEGKEPLLISLQSSNEFLDVYGLLKGFEIFKLSNPDNSLATPNPSSPARDSSPWFIQNFMSVIAGRRNTNATAVIAVLVLINIIAHTLRQIGEASLTTEERKPSARAERLFRRFSLAEIISATENFNHEYIIGKGGFGKVYKGFIDNGMEIVAIKRLKFSSRQGAHEFWTEIETLAELRHINLVSLIGYCNEQTELILVYEYMAGGTLADHLYKHRKEESNSCSLTWTQRVNICIGAARGLDYLHTGHGVIHRDVKPSNILLDRNLIPKVSDFGLAKSEKRNKSLSHVSTNVKGTFGYFDPYYFRTRKLTRKSDTYAFGVVLLEVLCGRRAMDPRLGDDKCSLTKMALDSISKDEVDQIIDSSLIGEISPASLKVFIGIAKRCLHDEPKQRPTMAQVVVQLEFALEQQVGGDLPMPNQIISEANDMSPSNDEAILSVGSLQITKDYTEYNPVTPQREQTSTPSNDKPIFSVGSQQLTKDSTEYKPVTPQREQTDSIMDTADLQDRNKDGRKIKMRKPLRIWGWDAFWNRVKPPKKRGYLQTAISEITEADLKLQKFDFATIAAATNKFSYKLGEGGFGPVYKAVLHTGQAVAVKRISPSSGQGYNEFKSEVYLLSNLQHRNIIKLLGYCIHREEWMLVYEFMENGSLDKLIFDEVKRRHLGWALRFKIILGVARGVLYLHQDSGLRIIHRSIKPSDILLDIDMNPKISDFGGAKSFENNDSEMTTLVAGTIGYICPEYFMTAKLSVKADVYGFGVLVLEIVSGRKRITYPAYDLDIDLIIHAWKLWNEARPEDLIDYSLGGESSTEEALRCIQVGLLCTQVKPEHRPTMPSVINMLLGEELSLDLQEKMAEAATHGGNMDHNNLFNRRNSDITESSFLEDSAATFENDSAMER